MSRLCTYTQKLLCINGKVSCRFLKKLLIVYSHKLSNVLEQEVRKCNARLTCWCRGTGSFWARSWHYLVWSPLSILEVACIICRGVSLYRVTWFAESFILLLEAALSLLSSGLQFYTSSWCKNTLCRLHAGTSALVLNLQFICLLVLAK